MPYTDRPGKRQRPLGDGPEVSAFEVSDESSTIVYAAPRCKLFIEGMWHGDYQQVPVDPEDVENLIEALRHGLGAAGESREEQMR
jgi:hypothetical protein